jgi:periplasmic mercuric ion binding protein
MPLLLLFIFIHLNIYIMKTVKLMIVIMLMASLGATAMAQSAAQAPKAKTETFKVWGKCGMCKTRIEKTVKADGAAEANWDSKTLMLTVTYDPAKTSKDDMSKKLAAVGHDTEKYKAPDDVYAKLPGCCHYERSK